MKKWLINSGLSILFSIVVVLSVFCVTLLNDNFVIRVLNNKNYYDEVYKDITVYLNKNYQEYNCSIDKSVLIKDIKTYFKKDFDIKKIDNNIVCLEGIDTKSVYYDFISIDYFNNKNMKMVYYVTFGITILLVILIGSLFIKTKSSHDIFSIFIISFIPLVLTYGLSYIFVDFNNEILNHIFNVANHYLLGISIILFEIGLFKKIRSRFKS